MSTISKPADRTEEVAGQIVAAIGKALKGDPEHLDALVRHYQHTPEMIAVIAEGSRAALFSAISQFGKRIRALEAQPKGLEYLGVWTDGGADYMRGHVVTRQGGMWVCKVDHCRSIPGADDGAGWTLAVKAGRDLRP